jgi:hypothetical protein
MGGRDLDKRIERVLRLIERVHEISAERHVGSRSQLNLGVDQCIAVAAIVDREEQAFDLVEALPGAGRGY